MFKLLDFSPTHIPVDKRCVGIHDNCLTRDKHDAKLCLRRMFPVLEKARCIIQDSELALRFWEEAVNNVIYLNNWSPAKAVKGKTPLEA